MAAAAAVGDRDPRGHRDAIDFFASGAAFGGTPPEQIETHAAHIFLAGDRAWKLKREIAYPYLDYSTAELRRRALEAELRLNRRTAPDLYLAVHAVTREPDGELAIDGAGDRIDWALEMRRFPDEALGSRQLLSQALLLELADRIHALHAAAPAVRTDGAARIRRIVEGNAQSFAATASIFDVASVAALLEAQRREIERHAAHLDSRAAAGRIRHGHGDLHLDNIAILDGQPTLFDCLEFSEELATSDVLYDLAFLLMDLGHRGQAVAANIVANRYVDVAPQGASGWALLPLFISIRAAVRAHVRASAALRAGRSEAAKEARSYLAYAGKVLESAPPKLVVVGGLSGTGKTTIARQLGAVLGRAPGARILRSDVFRKRLAGVAPETRLSASAYTMRSNAQTYEALFESADDHLGCGTSVILDAVFAARSERDVAEALAMRRLVPLARLWLEAPEQERVARVTARGADASDAGAQVVREQSRRSIGDLGGWHRMRVNRPLEMIVPAARAVIERARLA